MITSFWFAIYALFFVFLSTNVIKARHKSKTAFGEGDSIILQQAIRAHANFTEYTPIFLIGIYICESRLPANLIILTLLAAMFLVGRLLHFYALTKHEIYENNILKNSIKPRVIAMGITFFCLISLSLIALFNVCSIIINY